MMDKEKYIAALERVVELETHTNKLHDEKISLMNECVELRQGRSWADERIAQLKGTIRRLTGEAEILCSRGQTTDEHIEVLDRRIAELEADCERYRDGLRAAKLLQEGPRGDYPKWHLDHNAAIDALLGDDA